MPITAQTAENEYRKNPDLKREDIEELRKWNEEQVHLPTIPEVKLIIFHHSCYYDMELTKVTIDKHYTMRTHMKLMFHDRDPCSEENLFSLERMLVAPLPMRTSEGYKVIFCKFLDTDPANYFYEVTQKIYSMVHDLTELEEGTYPGYVMVFDMDGYKFAMMSRCSMKSMRDGFAYMQEGFPVRLKAFHVLNTPSYMSTMMAITKPFMNDQVYKMIHLHPAPIDTVFEYIPKEAFPADLGGKFDSFQTIISKTIARLKDNRDFYINPENFMRVDESKRHKEPSFMSRMMSKIW